MRSNSVLCGCLSVFFSIYTIVSSETAATMYACVAVVLAMIGIGLYCASTRMRRRQQEITLEMMVSIVGLVLSIGIIIGFYLI